MGDGVFQRHDAARGRAHQVNRRKREMLEQRVDVVNGVPRLSAAMGGSRLADTATVIADAAIASGSKCMNVGSQDSLVPERA
jgi:hypothetical protein